VPRAIKLVVMLRPTGSGFWAHLAAGADGCDPELRALEVRDVSSALTALEAVLATARERWQQHPRYPSLSRTTSGQRTRASGNRPSQPATSTTLPRPPTQAAPRRTADSPHTAPVNDQLELFASSTGGPA
jgi:hypothetical protein